MGSKTAKRLSADRRGETTFRQDVEDWDRVCREVAVLARRVAEEVTKDQRRVVRVILKLRYAPFSTSTHGRRLAAPSSDVELIVQVAMSALEMFTSRRPVRLLGVRAEFEV